MRSKGGENRRNICWMDGLKEEGGQKEDRRGEGERWEPSFVERKDRKS